MGTPVPLLYFKVLVYVYSHPVCVDAYSCASVCDRVSHSSILQRNHPWLVYSILSGAEKSRPWGTSYYRAVAIC